jgi:hypothetical protein
MSDNAETAQVVLEVGMSSSKCSACRRNADPNEAAHDMAIMRGEGCGATFTHVLALYPGTEDRVHEMRPDLIVLSIRPDLCRHCGKPPEADGDHNCPCPNPDDFCPDHPRREDPWNQRTRPGDSS